MDPNLLRHIEFFLEPNSQVRKTLPRCLRPARAALEKKEEKAEKE